MNQTKKKKKKKKKQLYPIIIDSFKIAAHSYKIL